MPDIYPTQDFNNQNLGNSDQLGQKGDHIHNNNKKQQLLQQQQEQSNEEESFNNSVTLKRNQLQKFSNFDKTVGNAGEVAQKLNYEQQRQIEAPISDISRISIGQRANSARSGYERYSLTTNQQQIYQQMGNSQNINQSQQMRFLQNTKERKIQEAKERRQARTKLDKVVKIQSLGRMYLAKQLLKRLKRKFKRLQQENKATNELKKFEQQCVESYFNERDRVVISEKFAQTFSQPQGPNTLASLGDLKRNVFYPTLFQALAEQGNLDILTMGNEKESEAAFNSTQKAQTKNSQYTGSQRPKTAENRTNYNYQAYKRPQNLKPTLENGFSQSYIKELQKDKKNSIIETFVRRNHPDAIRHAQKYAKTGSEEVQLRKLNKGEKEINQKIQNLKERLDFEHRQENNIQESSLSYASDFEKESIDNSLQKSKKTQPKKKLSTSRSRGSLQESISEENYYEESFEQESIQSDIKQDLGQKDSQRLSESMKIDEQISVEEMEEDIIQEDSGIKEEIIRSKSSGGIEEDIAGSDDYGDEGFESISEDVNNSQNKSRISEDIKSSLNFSKKKVSFGDQQGEKIKNIPQKQDNKNFNTYEDNTSQKYQTLEIKQQPIQQQQNSENNNHMQFQQYMQFKQFQQFMQQGGQQQQTQQQQQFVNLQPQMQFKKKEIPKDLDPEIKKVYEKYSSLKIFDQEMKAPIIKEQMEIKKLEVEIAQILNNTKKIQEKWQQDMEKDLNSNITIKAESLYTKFQCEFNNLLTTHKFGDKLKILSNFAFYKEMNDLQKESDEIERKYKQGGQLNEDQANKQQQGKFNILGNNVIKETLSNLENRQEIIIQVLNKVLENIGQIREGNADFSTINKNNKVLEENMRKIAEGQQKMMQKEFEKKQDQKFGEIKDMLKMVLNNQNKEQKQKQNKNRLQQLLDMNKDQVEGKKRKTSQEEYDDYLEMKYAQKKSDQEYIFDADYWKEIPYKHKPKDIPVARPVRNNYFEGERENLYQQQMSPRERKIVQEQNTNEIVNFLTDQLMAEINRDLFPMRANSSSVFEKLEKDNSREIESKTMDKFVSPKNKKRFSNENQDNSFSNGRRQIEHIKSPKVSGVETQSDESEFYPEESVEQDKSSFKKLGQLNAQKQNFFDSQNKIDNQKDNNNNKYEFENENNQENPFNKGQIFEKSDEKKQNNQDSYKQDTSNFSKQKQHQQQQQQQKDLQSENSELEDSLIEEKAQSVENQQRIKETKQILKYYQDVLKTKNKDKIINNILDIIQQNSKRTLPEFTGAALQRVKIFDSREIQNKEKDQLVLDCFQEKIVENLVISINDSLVNNKIKDQNKLKAQLKNKFNFFSEAAALKVQKMVKKLVPIDFYKDAQLQGKKFEDIYNYCQKNKGPEKNYNKGLNQYKYDETQDDYGEQYLKYEENQDAEKFKNEVTNQLIEGVFDDVASGYVKIFEKRKKHLK
ncbi:hypothetical protein PPERSA_04418 [Pseudocohnilembus persalinus]|uniref:IQ calmodulin-binding motif protein n=1 Tax=Pseudocohnilembus persalinus TaxID=266149 RepID=A0A0V0QQR8_PSEPJ|nr:hypothetical protein PPERSA_04418 [Pseudocohnilembus persalinus]|eukprot:KRX04603.1 hypothetical protein PPERSA_04418 [Pseudocohnilembus persalinus]